jgi:hypothetical protein
MQDRAAAFEGAFAVCVPPIGMGMFIPPPAEELVFAVASPVELKEAAKEESKDEVEGGLRLFEFLRTALCVLCEVILRRR